MTGDLPAGTRWVDAFAFDLNGIARGKRIPAADWAAAHGEAAFSASALVLDALGNAQGPLGIGTQDGDPDAWGAAVPGQTHSVPWAAMPDTAQVLLSLADQSRQPLWFDPRAILSGVADRCRTDGLHPTVACELEFYLVTVDANGRPSPPARPGELHPPHSAGHLCLQRVEDHAAFLHRLHDALAVQDIDAGTIVSEYGPGQFEINLRHGPDPVLAADQACLMRRAAQGVARSMGLRASFMAKPYADHPGNGLHVHVSLVDPSGANCFGAVPDGPALLDSALGGMQAVMAESMAMFAPSFSAWRRLAPGPFLSVDGRWAENDRGAALRIPSGGPASRRIEHRLACADASPHLVLACILAGLHHGVKTRAAPVDGVALPRDLTGALVALERATILPRYLPPRYPELFAAVKRGEMRALFEEIGAREYAFYL